MHPPLSLFPDAGQTIEGVGALLRSGATTCAAILEHCFHQIDLWDDRVHAWVVVDRVGAMHQARALDAELARDRCRGPLHGIPVGIKDIIDVAGLPTAAGFRPWRERVADRDADAVAALRHAGAVILGKTVTTQFAWVDPPPTRNPWNLERTPGGSSSGSAAAVATGMCLGALGSQTGGSIVRPASFCGVAGFKPGFGLVTETGVLPLAPSLDHPGPIARTLTDLNFLYRPLWSDDHLPAVAEDHQLPAYRLAEVDGQVARLKDEIRPGGPPTLYRPRGFHDRRADVVMLDAFERTLSLLSSEGAEVVDFDDESVDFEGVLREHRTILAAEAAAQHEERFATHRDHYLPHIHALIEEGLAASLTGYVRAQLAWQRGARGRADVFQDLPSPHVIVTPATVGPAPDTTTTGNPCFNSVWSYFGWPTLSFPIGLSPEGLPLAVQLVGSPFHDPFPAGLWCEAVVRSAANGGCAPR